MIAYSKAVVILWRRQRITLPAACAPVGATTLLEGGLSSTQRGYLSCLLHMGHLQGLLTQVEGLAINCDGELGRT